MSSLFRGKVPLCCDPSHESRDVAPGSEGLSETPPLYAVSLLVLLRRRRNTDFDIFIGRRRWKRPRGRMILLCQSGFFLFAHLNPFPVRW